MKLLRYGPRGQEKPGLLDDQGTVRDLSRRIADITPDVFSDEGLARIAKIDVASLPKVNGLPRCGVPFTGTTQFIAIGLNYSDHARESNMPVPTEPVIFTKAASCIQGAHDFLRKPRGSTKMDWEVELGVVIGRRAAYVEQARALAHVAGYCVVHDVSERHFQLERNGSWDKGKGCETFGPVGPWLVTRDEVGDVQDLDMWLDVNGKRMQTGNTRTMIFDVSYLVHYVSQFMVLHPGDIITTGTPPGVGMGMKPPVFLNEGDEVRLGIAKLGSQAQIVRAWDYRP